MCRRESICVWPTSKCCSHLSCICYLSTPTAHCTLGHIIAYSSCRVADARSIIVAALVPLRPISSGHNANGHQQCVLPSGKGNNGARPVARWRDQFPLNSISTTHQSCSARRCTCSRQRRLNQRLGKRSVIYFCDERCSDELHALDEIGGELYLKDPVSALVVAGRRPKREPSADPAHSRFSAVRA